MPMVTVQEAGKRGPGTSAEKAALQKSAVLSLRTDSSSARSSRSACREAALLSGGTNWSPSSRLSDRWGLKMPLSRFLSSALNVSLSLTMLFQKALPIATHGSTDSKSLQLPSSPATLVASERLNFSRPRSTPCRPGLWKSPGRCTKAARCTRRDCTMAVRGCAGMGATPRTALGRLTTARLTATLGAERGRLERTIAGACVGTNSRGGRLSASGTTAETTEETTLGATGALTLTGARLGRLMRKRSMPKLTAPGLLTIMPLAVGGAMRPGRLSWNLSTPNSTPP
mmetsp:Transcript_51801/g.165826  ORF Transcript_51801/g.165826 Transcript_51801/m.165826 type:complete len:285 (-) Transcript_51801:288-1142(-)